jgi:crossover junction endodeoxyribonuclease RuvC
MRILGIDPGLILTGYGCVELTTDAAAPALVEAGVIRMTNGRSVAYRLAQLFEDLDSVLADVRPDRMVVEKLFSHYRHVRVAIQMGHARGVVLLAGQRHGVEIDELVATEVKKAVTGNGHASKHQMQLAVMTQFGLSEPPNPPDVADAIGLALCASRRIVTGSRLS